MIKYGMVKLRLGFLPEPFFMTKLHESSLKIHANLQYFNTLFLLSQIIVLTLMS